MKRPAGLRPTDCSAAFLYATDFSAYAGRCIPCLSWMAGAHPEEVVVAHIQDLRHLRYASPEQMVEFNRRDEERLAALKRQFEKAGFANVSTVLRTGNAIDEVLSLAEEHNASLIALGAKGRHGVAEQIFGGVTEAVMHRAGRARAGGAVGSRQRNPIQRT